MNEDTNLIDRLEKAGFDSGQIDDIQNAIREYIKDKDEYNGWRNYETWAVNLWMSNELNTYNLFFNMAKEQLKAKKDKSGRTREGLLADQIKETISEEFLPPDSDSPFGPAEVLFNVGWSNVDWYEIAANWLVEAKTDLKARKGRRSK